MYLTIGIPTIYREANGFSYLVDTVQDIIIKTSQSEKSQIRILIFAADFNETLRELAISLLVHHYQPYLYNGLITIITVQNNIYPSFENLKLNFNDTEERVRWRSKQVIDYALMFRFGRRLSRYYLQIEDDVICSFNFVEAIKDFVENQNEYWVTLEFSNLGFIGKGLGHLPYSSGYEQKNFQAQVTYM